MPRSMLQILLVALGVMLVATACGGVDSATGNPVPTATPTPTPSPTAVGGGASVLPTPVTIPDDATPDPTAEPTSTTTPAPTATPPPIATAVPTSTPAPTATTAPAPTTTPAPTATPRPTATPAPTATTVPAPTPTPTGTVRPVVSCSITPQRNVAIREALVFRAESTPAAVPVTFRFDHGDGTLDPGARSDAYYLAPGRYSVHVDWWSPGYEGTKDCGTVTVVGAHGCWIGLGPADGLGWWCGATFCGGYSQSPQAAQATNCPTEPPWGCYTTMAGTRTCVERSTPVECLVGNGPADEFGWYCNGVWCDPQNPRAECPPYPIYGCHKTVSGHIICIDPPAYPTMSCTISDTSVEVGEVVTLRAIQTGPEIPVDVVFNHGDGTEDPRWVAYAYYENPGSYQVTLDWSHAGGSGTTVCGTVVVS